ncbi:hypothetical protein BAN_0095602 (plasmid) [Borrelia anserina BA2]|uniref:Uncharacterized protein n=1 Tax=Borrelia anserina BA2 TaxID=1313293 RepID=W5SQA3_BORAN|nr:hypothetical protein BAN_0095602 [Borrelia anserina BA2]
MIIKILLLILTHIFISHKVIKADERAQCIKQINKHITKINELNNSLDKIKRVENTYDYIKNYFLKIKFHTKNIHSKKLDLLDTHKRQFT